MEIFQNDFILSKVIEIFGKDLIQNAYILTSINDIESDKRHLEHVNKIPNELEGDVTICILFKNNRLIQFNIEHGIYLLSKG